MGSGAALFTFPVPDRTDWSWNDSSVAPGRFEHRWDVTVADSQQTYRVGFLQARFPGAAPAHGTLAQLIAAGQQSFFVFNSSRGVADSGVRVEVIPGVGRLWVYLRDPDAVARLFGSQPRSVIFHSLLGGQTADSGVVRVTYLKSGGPELPASVAHLADDTALGKQAPDLDLPLLAAPPEEPAKRERLSSFRGHPVVLYLW